MISLKGAPILLINEIRKITFLVVNGIFYTFFMENIINFVLVGRIICDLICNKGHFRQDFSDVIYEKKTTVNNHFKSSFVNIQLLYIPNYSW